MKSPYEENFKGAFKVVRAFNRGEQTVRLWDLIGLGIHIFPCSKRARFRHSELLRSAAEPFGSDPKLFLRHRSTARLKSTLSLRIVKPGGWDAVEQSLSRLGKALIVAMAMPGVSETI